MSKQVALSILDHPNKDEILSKLIMGINPKEIYDWLDNKYGMLNNSNLVLSTSGLTTFKDEYLEYTVRIRDDLQTVSKRDKDRDTSTEVNLALQGNKDYEEKLVHHLEREINLKEKMINMFDMAEQRVMQVYDLIQQNPNSFKGDRILLEWFDKIGAHLERYHKIILAVPETTVNNTVTINIVDQQASKIQNAIRATLSHMDNETSMTFIDIFTKELEGLKDNGGEKLASLEDRYIEAQLVEDKLNK